MSQPMSWAALVLCIIASICAVDDHGAILAVAMGLVAIWFKLPWPKEKS